MNPYDIYMMQYLSYNNQKVVELANVISDQKGYGDLPPVYVINKNDRFFCIDQNHGNYLVKAARSCNLKKIPIKLVESHELGVFSNLEWDQIVEIHNS
jgi:hypothetical protein